MAEQAYPDLMDPWEMTIVPLHGLPFGNGLLLHRGGKHPELAFAFGFRPSPFGFVFDPGEPDPDFGVSLGCVTEAISAILPSTRFVSADPVLLSVAARRPATDLDRRDEIVAQRHRFMIRQTLGEAPEVCAPRPRIRPPGIDMERDRALPDRIFGASYKSVPDLVYLNADASIPSPIGSFGSPVGFFASAGSDDVRLGHGGSGTRRARHRDRHVPGTSNPSPANAMVTEPKFGPAFHAKAQGSRPIASSPPSFAAIDALIGLRDGDEGCDVDDVEDGYGVPHPF